MEFPFLLLSISIYFGTQSDIRVKSSFLLNLLVSSILILSVSIYYGSQSDIWLKSYCRLNFYGVSIFNFEHLDILCAWIEAPSDYLWPFEFLRASVVQFRPSRYIICLNRTSELKVMTIWISRVLRLFNFERLYMRYAWIRAPSEK